MRKLVPVLIVAVIGWMLYNKHQEMQAASEEADAEEATFVDEEDPAPEREEPRQARAVAQREFECNGRTRCHEVHSCEEARWVSKHCPGTKMDGDRDGIPCEDEFCGH